MLFLPQLDNVDEQAAQIRRELDGRLQLAEKISRVRNSHIIIIFNFLFVHVTEDRSYQSYLDIEYQ